MFFFFANTSLVVMVKIKSVFVKRREGEWGVVWFVSSSEQVLRSDTVAGFEQQFSGLPPRTYSGAR